MLAVVVVLSLGMACSPKPEAVARPQQRLGARPADDAQLLPPREERTPRDAARTVDHFWYCPPSSASHECFDNSITCFVFEQTMTGRLARDNCPRQEAAACATKLNKLAGKAEIECFSRFVACEQTVAPFRDGSSRDYAVLEECTAVRTQTEYPFWCATHIGIDRVVCDESRSKCEAMANAQNRLTPDSPLSCVGARSAFCFMIYAGRGNAAPLCFATMDQCDAGVREREQSRIAAPCREER
jgi:hypothetical protein